MPLHHASHGPPPLQMQGRIRGAARNPVGAFGGYCLRLSFESDGFGLVIVGFERIAWPCPPPVGGPGLDDLASWIGLAGFAAGPDGGRHVQAVAVPPRRPKASAPVTRRLSTSGSRPTSLRIGSNRLPGSRARRRSRWARILSGKSGERRDAWSLSRCDGAFPGRGAPAFAGERASIDRDEPSSAPPRPPAGPSGRRRSGLGGAGRG